MGQGPQDARSRLSRHLGLPGFKILAWLARLQEQGRLRGFKIKDVPGDNNCQFHALTDQLEQLGISGWSAAAERWTTAPSASESFKLRDSVGVEDWDRYIREMSQHGATLLAASVIFKTEIVVISSLSPDYCHTITPPDGF
ncbi:hypothetical protein EMIHUDRAFT_223354 [Emiliania huxleyi CCMP1516]|uniref:OTU domain-containing protein n=2 Tax=Emiliania huxleyi TaxID=2903 RepID=A0A0D3KVM7_EMIH1|nr:hypothetical protein EMIHUDRAFT_223354 [Emiliania huxleyi CCMP1516]EOD39812.1 hypothetical protein EMIHUDRAFT_223354 [Emiliania huxleyi CCMP1516]|eukprot:XP_005792241.1 hypothetical protein EMIHUDRAFT_223354 [Emiliania huxleyi CCMP1516]